MTLDGVMQAPGGPAEDRDGGFAHGGWSSSHFSEDMGEVISDAFAKAEAFLLGRRTYEVFAGSWTNYPEKYDPVASRLNTLPKYIVATTRVKADWDPPRSSATTSPPGWPSSRASTRGRSRFIAAPGWLRRCTPRTHR